MGGVPGPGECLVLRGAWSWGVPALRVPGPRGVSAPEGVPALGGAWSREGAWSWVVPAQGDAWSQGGSAPEGDAWSRGVLVTGGFLVETHWTATAASGMHPTGMHSCIEIFSMVEDNKRSCRKITWSNHEHLQRQSFRRFMAHFHEVFETVSEF